MFNKIKDYLKGYYDEFSLLPDPLKMFIVAALFITLGFSIFYGIRNYVQSLRISNLERVNSELSVEASQAHQKANQAETNAANEALRARSLEEKLKTLETKEKNTDEKIKTSRQTSDNLRNNLHRIRVSSPANVSTDELERRLCERYPEDCNK